MNVLVIFDGECGVCTRTIRLLHAWDRRGVLAFRPCQSVPLDGVHGVTPAKCLRSVWAIADDGTIATGSDAAGLILTALVRNHWPYRICRLPMIRQALSLGYRLIAKNRRKLPGETPWCQQHPEDCDHLNPIERIVL